MSQAYHGPRAFDPVVPAKPPIQDYGELHAYEVDIRSGVVVKRARIEYMSTAGDALAIADKILAAVDPTAYIDDVTAL